MGEKGDPAKQNIINRTIIHENYQSGDRDKSSFSLHSFIHSFWPETLKFSVYIFQIKHCEDLSIPADKSSTLFLFIGICATIGRLGGGFLCNIKCIKAIRLYQTAAFLMGASTMLLTLAKTYVAVAAYAVVFGAMDGLMVTTFIIALLDSADESKKASIFGFSLMCSSVGALSSPPLSGR